MSRMDDTENTSAKHKEEHYVRRLEEATEIVRSWPEWKQHVLGPATPEQWKIEREAQSKLADM